MTQTVTPGAVTPGAVTPGAVTPGAATAATPTSATPTPGPPEPAAGPAARAAAERAALRRLLNTYLRETGAEPVPGTRLRVPLPAAGADLFGELRHRSVLGHHDYGETFSVAPPGGAARPVGHDEVVALLLAEVAAVAATAEPGGRDTVACTAELTAQIANSVARTARYLEAEPRPCPPASEAWALTRHAEQTLLLGHPFHPTPKSAEGFDPGDLTAYTPELGATFALHWLAVAPELVVTDRVGPGDWVPAGVEARARRELGPERADWALLPVHPWQQRYLQRQPAFTALHAAGSVRPLGALGPTVYPTSSVRTVCDPAFGTVWKLPLHVRITNFVRTNPPEHARRAADASRVVAGLRGGWEHQGFEVLLETGYRGVTVAELAADLTVLHRENPTAAGTGAPQVVAALLEEHPDRPPPLLDLLRRATGRARGALPPAEVAGWLRRYLDLSLVPLLAVFAADGVSLEAHVQNSLLEVADGWPVRFLVRDMEGVSVARDSRAAAAVPADSPVLVDEAQAWLRLRYYVLTNHIGHLVAVLARHAEVDEAALWAVVAECVRAVPAGRYRDELLSAPVLPAKANLLSRFVGRGEHPLYVEITNPLQGVLR